MDIMLEFNIMDELITIEPDMKEFKEFCTDLDKLSLIVNPELYLEAMVDNNIGFFDKISKSINKVSDTKKTTKETLKAYGDVTDAGGYLIKSVWDASLSAIKLAIRILKFITINLAKIPTMIVNVFKMVGQIPQEVRNKIRGNIKLYVTATDIGNFHNKILPLISEFLSDAKTMSEGEVWGTFFNRRSVKGIINLSENDMALSKKMKSSYNKLKLIDFQETLIEMKNHNIINIYFGGSKSIRFTDSKGNKQETSYYEALLQLFKILQTEEKFLKDIQTAMGEKFDKSQMNQSISKLSESAQKHITESIQMISKIINIIGNLLRYVMKDMKTLRDTSEKILRKRNVPKIRM